MAELVLIGRIIAVDQQQTIASKTDATKTFQRRKVYLDCSRYDSITGEQLSENKPLLEFGSKGLDQLNELVKQGLKKGDIVSIKFAVQGDTYKDEHGNTKNFTGVRPYAIERYVTRSQQNQQQTPAQAQQTQQPAPATSSILQQQQQAQPQQASAPFPPADIPPVQTSQDGTDGLPF
jgi:hypothetical protein